MTLLIARAFHHILSSNQGTVIPSKQQWWKFEESSRILGYQVLFQSISGPCFESDNGKLQRVPFKSVTGLVCSSGDRDTMRHYCFDSKWYTLLNNAAAPGK